MGGRGWSGGAKSQGTLEPLEVGRGEVGHSLESISGREEVSVVRSHQVCDHLLQEPSDLSPPPCTLLGQERKRYHRAKPVFSPCCVEASGLGVHMEQGHSHPPAWFSEG